MNATMTIEQHTEIEKAKLWITKNMPSTHILQLTNTSVENGQLSKEGVIIAIIINNRRDLARYRNLAYQYNKESVYVVLRVLMHGNEDCYTDLQGGLIL